MLVLSQDLDLQRHMSWSFLCSGSYVRMIGDCLFDRCRGLSCVQGVKMIGECSFCRCRSLSCVQGVRMIGDCLFCRCHGLSCVQGVMLR